MGDLNVSILILQRHKITLSPGLGKEPKGALTKEKPHLAQPLNRSSASSNRQMVCQPSSHRAEHTGHSDEVRGVRKMKKKEERGPLPSSTNCPLSSLRDRCFQGALHILHVFRVPIGVKDDHYHLPFSKWRFRQSGSICSISSGDGLEHVGRSSRSGFMLLRLHIYKPDSVDRAGLKPLGMDAQAIPTKIGCSTGIWMWFGRASNGILVSPAQEAETKARMTKPKDRDINILLVSMMSLLIFFCSESPKRFFYLGKNVKIPSAT